MQIIRGVITQLDPKAVKAKAELPDMDGMETDWLPVPQFFTVGAKSFHLPRKDEQCYVFFLDAEGIDGFIVLSRYSQKATPPDGVAEKDFYLSLEDGTKLHLTEGFLKIETPGDIQAKAGGNAKIEAGGAATVKASEATIETSGKTTIKANEIALDAPLVKISGKLEVAVDAEIGGKQFLVHKHTCAAAGSPSTPPI
jgi:phage baseplate assembly protein V